MSCLNIVMGRQHKDLQVCFAHSVPLGFQNPDIQNERRRPKVNRVHYDAMRYTIQTIKYIYIIQPTNYIMNHLILCTQKHFTPPPFTPGSYEELP